MVVLPTRVSLISLGAELVDTIMVRFRMYLISPPSYKVFVGRFEEAERTLRCASRIPDHPLTRRWYWCRIGMPASVEAAGSAFLDESLYLLVVQLMTSAMQEYPDRMLATFSILPSPSVSETVVEVSCATPKEDFLDVSASLLDSHTMHCFPFTSSLRTVI